MRKYKIMALIMVAVVMLNTAVVAGKTATQLNTERNSIKNQIKDTKAKLEQVKTQKSQAQAEADRLDMQLNEVQAELDRITGELDDTKARLVTSEAELKTAVENREAQYETLKKRVRVMYENGNVGYLQVVFEADGFSDFLRRVEYINRLMEYDNEILANYQKEEEIIATKVEEITRDKESLEALESQQAEKKKTLDNSIAAKTALITQLNTDENTYNQQISKLEKSDKEIESMLRTSSRVASTGSSSNRVYSSTNTTYQYPVPAYNGYRPNSGYGYRSSPISGRSEFHTGLDLKATLNTDVVAAESGTVIFAGNKGGYGKTVIVDHGNGRSTLYAHNNKLVVSVGQSVKRGQVISKAGTTGYSTGVHVHFEVRINGSHTNPTSYIYD